MKKDKDQGLVAGIDLGTTFSGIASLESDGTTKIIPNLDGEALTPSVVNLRDEKNPVVGRAAVNQSAYSPEHTAALFKRSMGKCDSQGNSIPAFSHPDSGRIYTSPELSGMVIRYLVKSAESAAGRKVKGVVISVPAYFNSVAREATRRAGELAGVKVIGIVNEPTAAGLAFGLDKGESGKFTIFDLGGGTFDATVLEIADQEFRVRATDGDRDRGGSDIDNLLAAKLVEAFKAEHGIEISPQSDAILWRELIEKSENAKKTLSQSDVASFMISAQDKRLIFEITRAEFNSLIDPLVGGTKAITGRALAAAGLGPKDIDDVILAGGSTRIPAVREMLSEMFGKPPRSDINPDEAVARGAAIFAAKAAGDAGLAVVDTQGNKVLPPAIQVTEVTSQSLGCLAEVHGVLRNSVIIPANTTVPVEKEESFGLIYEDQTAARVSITAGDHLADPAACTIYGHVELTGLPKRAPRNDDIVVKYGFNADGTLHVTITDKLSGKTTSEIKRGLESVVAKVA